VRVPSRGLGHVLADLPHQRGVELPQGGDAAQEDLVTDAGDRPGVVPVGMHGRRRGDPVRVAQDGRRYPHVPGPRGAEGIEEGPPRVAVPVVSRGVQGVDGVDHRAGKAVERVQVALRGRVPHADEARELPAADGAVDGRRRAVGVDDIVVAVAPDLDAQLPRGDPLDEGPAVGGQDVDGPARLLHVLDIDEPGRFLEQRRALVQEVVDVHAAAQALDDLPVQRGDIGEVPVELADGGGHLRVAVGADAVQLVRVLAEHPGQAVRGVGEGRPLHLARGVGREVFPGAPEPVHQLVEAPALGFIEDRLDALQGFLADPRLAHLRGLLDELEFDEAAVETLDRRDLHAGLDGVAGDLAGALGRQDSPLPDVAGCRSVGDVCARHPQRDLAREESFLGRVEDLVDAGHGVTLSPSRCGR